MFFSTRLTLAIHDDLVNGTPANVLRLYIYLTIHALTFNPLPELKPLSGNEDENALKIRKLAEDYILLKRNILSSLLYDSFNGFVPIRTCKHIFDNIKVGWQLQEKFEFVWTHVNQALHNKLNDRYGSYQQVHAHYGLVYLLENGAWGFQRTPEHLQDDHNKLSGRVPAMMWLYLHFASYIFEKKWESGNFFPQLTLDGVEQQDFQKSASVTQAERLPILRFNVLQGTNLVLIYCSICAGHYRDAIEAANLKNDSIFSFLLNLHYQIRANSERESTDQWPDNKAQFKNFWLKRGAVLRNELLSYLGSE